MKNSLSDLSSHPFVLNFQSSFHAYNENWVRVYYSSPDYSRYTCFEWAIYRSICNQLITSVNRVSDRDYLLLDASLLAKKKIAVWDVFFPNLRFEDNLDCQAMLDELDLIIISVPAVPDHDSTSSHYRLGFLSCYPSAYRLIQIASQLKLLPHRSEFYQDDCLKLFDASNNSMQPDFELGVHPLQSQEAVRIWLDLSQITALHLLLEISLNLLGVAINICKKISPYDPVLIEIQHALLREFRSLISCGDVTNPHIFERLCWYYERIHHLLFAFYTRSKPFNQNAVEKLWEQISSYSAPGLAPWYCRSILLPSTMHALLLPLFYFAEKEPLPVGCVPLAPTVATCCAPSAVYFELDLAIRHYNLRFGGNDDQPKSLIYTGLNTESELSAIDISQLQKEIAKGLKKFKRVMLVVDLPFRCDHLIDLLASQLAIELNSGKLIIVLVENMHKFKGLGVEKCISSRITTCAASSSQAVFPGFQEYLTSHSKELSNNHEEFQYVYGVAETGFKFELPWMRLVEENSDWILSMQNLLWRSSETKPSFKKGSILLFVAQQMDPRHSSSIPRANTFSFPFTTFCTYFNQNGTEFYASRLSVGLEPKGLLLQKLQSAFAAAANP